MKIEVNGEPKDVSANTTLDALVNEIVDDTKGIAVAIDNSVVSKNSWTETRLSEGAKVLIIKASQGG